MKLVFVTPDALQLIEDAGRTCYKSEALCDGTVECAKNFVNKIMTKNHESVIEHAIATFRIITDRGVTHEIVRHRLASYSQESTRYCNYSKDKFGSELSVILPVWFYDDQVSQQYETWKQAMILAENHYFSLLTQGQTPQQARAVLPNSLKTEIVMTANFREWRHFFELRTSSAAHPQMRELALQGQNALRETQPGLDILFG